MKMLAVIFTLSLANLFASELGGLEGQYLVAYQTEVGPIPGSVISLEQDGKLVLFELTNPSGGQGDTFICRGQARLVGEAIQSYMTCQDGKEYAQTIYNIDQSVGTDYFVAEVTSTLFPGDVLGAVFVRLTKEMREQIETDHGPLPF